MNRQSTFDALVFVDAKFWSLRTERELVSDWLEPIAACSRIRNIVLAGDIGRFAQVKTHPKVKWTGGGLERSLLERLSTDASVDGVVRLFHFSKLRFPIKGALLNAVMDGYLEKVPGGYFQIDLADLPYPYLMPEVIGRDAGAFLKNNSGVPLDWNTIKSFHAAGLAMERGALPYEARLEYLDEPRVEYYTFPKFMALESSRLCNLRCTMCVTHSDFIDHSHLEKYPKHFDLEKYKWILDQMEPFREHVSIAPQFQGEPFMAPHISEMIAYARKKNFCVGFTSNATLWSEEIIDFLIDQEVNNLCVSLDGATKESYERVRLGANFDTVVANLNRLVARKQERGVALPWLSINMTLMPENRHEQEKLLSEWLGKAYLVSINNTCINHVVPEKFHQPERYPCPYLWEGVHILTNGDVIACCRDSDYEEVMGNAYDTPILEIWNGEKYRRFRHLHQTKRWNDIPICARCDTWMCKTKKTVNDGGRMVFQYPFYRQFVAPSNSMVDHSIRATLEDLWGSVKGTTSKVTTTLLSLNPLWRKAS